MKSNLISFYVFSILLMLTSCASEKPSQDTSAVDIEAPAATEVSQTPIDIDHVMGKFQPSEDDQFVVIDLQYASRENMYLRKDTYEAFQKMHAAAKADGVSLVIKSATRNFYDQKRIWENKWSGKTLVESGQNLAETVDDPKERALVILKYSSMPGSSRHHWGTDIDVNNFENSYFESGQGLIEYNWLVANGPKFGFCQPYTPKDEHRPNGYNEEKWHWSYLPVAKQLTDFVGDNLQNVMISGFQGAETAKDIDVKSNYMLGINQECLPDNQKKK